MINQTTEAGGLSARQRRPRFQGLEGHKPKVVRGYRGRLEGSAA